jgi:hypothetical protein
VVPAANFAAIDMSGSSSPQGGAAKAERTRKDLL